MDDVQISDSTSTSVTRRLTVTIALLVVVFGGSLSLASCASGPPPISHTSTTISDRPDTSTQDPSFLPSDPNRNLSECIGTVERPGCGSKARGGWRMALTFGVLMLGIALIGTIIVRSARRRGRRQTTVPENVRWAKPTEPSPMNGPASDA